ncbi:MAG TPA: hypothetical protein VMG37_12990 [Solirubrobacteraceae bacterium]|nr:hypothetical protein [Solirubrobacteraceae bacterium]
MTTLIATISMLAAVIGIAGIVPQLITMLRAHSSAGQSTVGWSFGIMTNTSLAFVNLLGYHALVLGSGNLASLTGCLTAVYLVRRFRRAAQLPVDGAEAVTDLRTQEFEVLRDAVLVEHHRRTGERELALA